MDTWRKRAKPKPTTRGRTFTFTCAVCGRRFTSRSGESLFAFSARVFDDHTIRHVLAGVTPSISLDEALTDLLDLVCAQPLGQALTTPRNGGQPR